ncbi:phosphoribosyl-AMP cyclohydrolase [Candidatus Portiera aleyrodidarum]|uniref:Histidine biosynthesis bifunctional protein HisIE n=1 Tax=Candidatus Portiera aleyrodidarum MED (Bemisia tabaci) TaxID=1163752 RepID=A0AAU8RP81_9GAMM|nr:phosphoribosyl-AMP cyclohydrolase [Candidatus Portiera aleyrodidarum]AFQ24106.1 phosphoribosyl-AMP cyclohydrolase [Candidatus Portiera aleyrodidarum BT-B-HRs]AFS18869.1 Phosphoribosyl-AMP cyclohydrolase [Candidatus Portiera aleyrodidarum BT-QVLC]AFT80500.1 Phosphoribosyl-AMP cyclohydrolase [Candidatus Portiera aleyrodidarum BT-QVLC]AFT80779.1 Phosphoribosyl-AMP cyclohydrolase [Candidatus Portiera aleyrodidarum BT-B-HRs]AJF24082.1 phosphoribosyl-AMP cyclohydrolase [Candidatus Portiera aleyro
MKQRILFQSIDFYIVDDNYLNDIVIESINWNQEGLIPVITQQYDSGEVLMLAWINKFILLDTQLGIYVCYWSRSRCKTWLKGEQSGNIQLLKEIYLDCDGDTLLFKVDQYGPSCHSGRISCFYNKLLNNSNNIAKKAIISPKFLYR